MTGFGLLEIAAVRLWELNRGDDGWSEDDGDINKSNKEINHGGNLSCAYGSKSAATNIVILALEDERVLKNAEARSCSAARMTP